MNIKRRHHLRKSEIRDLVKELKLKFGIEIGEIKGGSIEIAELEEGGEIILMNGEPFVIKTEKEVFPSIRAARSLCMKSVTVDMGAVGPISNGADIMAPGIVDVDEGITSGELVGVKDEDHHKLIAVGIAIRDGAALLRGEGKAVKSVHHVGDKYWDLCKIFPSSRT